MSGLPYPLVCAVLGFGLAWVPYFLHGPIPEKFDPHLLEGSVTVWAFYTARMLIGFFVGISSWPHPWWLRGPLVGFLCLLPLAFVSLSVPECGPP